VVSFGALIVSGVHSFLMDSMSCLFSLLIMEGMALWQREVMSFSSRVLSRLSTSEALSGSDLFLRWAGVGPF
jgi:hypothetical protein